MTRRILRAAILTAALLTAATIGHNVRWYGMPWQAATPEPVACLAPAPDGPVTIPGTGQAWPEVCWQTPDGPPLNSGAALSLWGHYCAGIEWRGTPGVFYDIPFIGDSADC